MFFLRLWEKNFTTVKFKALMGIMNKTNCVQVDVFAELDSRNKY